MGVGLSSIQRWISQYKKEQQGITTKASGLSPEQIRIQELEKHVKQLKSDNQILKKVQQICRCLSIAASTFYYRSKPKAINAEQVKLEAAMKQVHVDMDATYGKRRMLIELQTMGFNLGIHKVRTVMRRLKLIAKRPKMHRYPSSEKASVIAPNHLNRQFNPEQLNTLWSGDITYIRTQQGWLYLAVIMDLCSRNEISWAFSDKPNSELTTKTIRLAVNKRQPNDDVIFHSNQGA